MLHTDACTPAHAPHPPCPARPRLSLPSVSQTILDACGVIEGLKGFKYLDDKGKDQGINVSSLV